MATKIKKLRWGLLSTANINKVIIPVLRESARGELAAVASRDKTKAEIYAKEWNIPHAYGSYEAMLAADDIDVIYISLPNSLHAEWAIKCVEAGKHVLVEKPFAVSVEEVDRMIAAVKRSGKVMAEVFMYRHHPQTFKLKELIEGGVIGSISYMRATFSFTIASNTNIRLDPALGGGSLWDVGCYPVSLAQYIFGGRPEEVFGWQKLDPTGIDGTFIGQMRYSGGRLAQFDSSFREPLRTYAEIVGSKGVITLTRPFKPDGGKFLLSVNGRDEIVVIPDVSLYAGEVENLHGVILDGVAPRVSLQESRDHVATLHALYQAARENKPVQVWH